MKNEQSRYSERSDTLQTVCGILRSFSNCRAFIRRFPLIAGSKYFRIFYLLKAFQNVNNSLSESSPKAFLVTLAKNVIEMKCISDLGGEINKTTDGDPHNEFCRLFRKSGNDVGMASTFVGAKIPLPYVGCSFVIMK